MSNQTDLTIGDLTPGNTISGARSYVKFDPAEMAITEYSVIESGVPITVYHGRHLYLGKIPLDVSERGLGRLEDWLQEQAQTLREIAEGYDEAFDGSNIRGHLSDHAAALLENLRYDIDVVVQNLPTTWEAGEYFAECRREALEEVLNEGSIEEWARNEVDRAQSHDADLEYDDVLAFGRELVKAQIETLQELL